MLALLTLAAALQASPQPSESPSTAPSPAATASTAASTEDPAITKVAKQELAAWQAGKPDPSHYVKAFPDSTVQQVHAFLNSLGTVSSVTFVKNVQPQGAPWPLSVYLMKGANANGYLIIHVNDAAKVDFILFRPAQ